MGLDRPQWEARRRTVGFWTLADPRSRRYHPINARRNTTECLCVPGVQHFRLSRSIRLFRLRRSVARRPDSGPDSLQTRCRLVALAPFWANLSTPRHRSDRVR